MCSYFLKRMENYNQGDLTDILRATGTNTAAATSTAAPSQWQFQTNPIDYPTCPAEDFGDPFTRFRDPLLDGTLVSGFFHNSNIIKAEETGSTAGFATAGGNKKIIDDEMKKPNFFSRMLQISPSATPSDSPAAAPPCPSILVSNDHTLISPNNSKGLQISSPRNTGIRRRICGGCCADLGHNSYRCTKSNHRKDWKSQAKKVVCIPAPAPANSRASGEVVPSDLWAWRKYGQKPIKGSPYPRGYYRCSSSKGCSARKQVERSRTDPNMLVITYTSEHNHPWPTQRNALAGSTRSQPSKTATTTSKSPPNSHAQNSTNPKEQQKGITTENTSRTTTDALVKEETNLDSDNRLEMEEIEFNQGIAQSYKPALPEQNHSEDSFFADLGEIEGDSLDILLGFGSDDVREDKGLDPFSFYDWGGTNTTSSSPAATFSGGATTSYGEAKRDS